MRTFRTVPDSLAPILNVAEFRRCLGLWARASSRDLPWRNTRDPWAVLVSEVMLQQTQVARVVDKYRAFLRQFPTVAACADASVASVIEQWAGLGYNRRAVMLHHLARAVVMRHGGALPDDLTELLDLPGVGPYTARAVLAFAFERDVAVLDTNVGRVLARVGGRRLAPSAAQAQADRLVAAGTGWAWNQAMLDLGATVCTARAPKCGACPLRNLCVFRGAGDDPAVGSAAVSGRQSRFAGSDRQGRGRLVAAMREGPLTAADLASAAGWPDDEPRAQRAMATLIIDGLAQEVSATFRLPEPPLR